MTIQMEQHLNRVEVHIAAPTIAQNFVRIDGFMKHVQNLVENVKLLLLQWPRQQLR